MAGLISPSTLEQVRAASDIVEIIGGSVPLKRAGANFVALCPFHKEKSPSFNVNPHRQIFHCFGCHKGGDVFTFIKEYEGIGFMDAVRRLAERARIPLEFDSQPGQQEARHLKEILLQIHEQIAQRWQAALRNDASGRIAREYLAKRGVSDEAAELFRLGCAPDLWDDTVNWAKSKNHELPLVEKAGLIVRKEGSDRYYDRFRGRLMFPICDEQGRVIGFSGRVLSGDEKTAKYVNSPETPIFTKGKVFFGLDKSKRALLDAQTAIVCEGQLDLIACYMAGVRNVIAPQGTALTAEHARILKRYADEAVLCFDSDTAGQNAAIRSLDGLLAAGLAVRVATMPPPHDPDSFIQASGAAAFQELIDKAEGFFDFYLNRLCAANDLGTDKGRLAVVQEMAAALNKSGSTVLLDKYAQKTALRLGVAADAVRAEFKKRPGRETPAQTEEPLDETEPVQRPSPQEFWLLKLLLQQDDCVEPAIEFLDANWLAHPLLREVVSKRLEAAMSDSWTGLAGWISSLESAAAKSLATEAVAEDESVPDPRQCFADLMLRLRNQHLDREIAMLTRRMSAQEISGEQQLELLLRQKELRAAKQQPLQSAGPL